MRNTKNRAITLGIAIVAGISAVALFTPFLGRARIGPMSGFAAPMGMRGMGPMSFSMMREVHEMADVESELDYMVRMIPHHQEAIDSARVLLDRTDRREMREFAETIIATQTREIEQMESWLETWYPRESHEYDYTPMMSDYSQLSGDRLDAAFLQEMIPHHMAAVMMSQQLLSSVDVEHEEVDRLAASIRDTQTREIRQMGQWLDRWFR